MGRRQQRIEAYHVSLIWNDYLGKEMNVVCTNGAVYHCILKKVDEKTIFIQDFLGETITLSMENIKEIILDFVTDY
jgi:hypothetical protein